MATVAIGEARTWILLRGLARHSLHWADFPVLLQKTFPQDQILCLDSRGNGREAHLPAYLDVRSSMRDLHQRSLSLVKNKNVYLLSISLGSMLAIEWAQQYPEELKGLICINTSAAGVSPLFHRLRPKSYGALFALFTSGQDRRAQEDTILRITTSSYLKNPARIKTFLEDYANAPATGKLSALTQLASAARFRLPKQAPKVPTLLLASEEDQLVSPECSRALSQYWQVPLHTHPWGGHDLPMDDGPWICEKLALFAAGSG